MKTIGLIGGTSWFSTVDYYTYLNQETNKKLGGDNAAKILLYSVNYGEIKTYTQKDDWKTVTDIISDAALSIQNAGADIVLLCANTMHNIYDEVEKRLSIPMLHIADAVAGEIKKQQLSKVALLGTKYTMTLPFFIDRMKRHNIETIVPDKDGVETINNTIYEELSKGLFLPETKKVYQNMIDELKDKGAQGVILGCTEIPMLIKQADSNLPVFDTTLIHSKAAVDFALKN